MAETGDVCLSGAYVDITDPASSSPVSLEGTTLQSDIIFSEMGRRVKEKPALIDNVNAVFAYVLTKGT